MTLTPVVARAQSLAPSERRRRLHALRLSLWRDGLQAFAWLAAVAAVSFFLASGAMVWTMPSDAVLALGRFAGIVATVLILVQVVLASRAPWVEQAIGHDKALKLHGSLGEPIFYLLIAHAALLLVAYGAPEGRGVLGQATYFYLHSERIALSVLALGLFLIVAVTSIAAVRRKWPYETWYAIHLVTYAAIALAVPHQFFDGTSFRFSTWAEVFWVTLYAVAFGSLAIWRFAMPLSRALRHRLRVTGIERHADGTVSVTVGGRQLERMRARPGQFFMWRFLSRDLWAASHPYSLSSVPDGRSLRITVKALGDDSAAVAGLRPGVRVIAEGPLGRFTHTARVRNGLVLVGAGIGVTPIRAMLEDAAVSRGPCTVIVRVRSMDEAPLMDEIRRLAYDRGAPLYLIEGPRGTGWSAKGSPSRLRDLAPNLADCDVFVCGPEKWAAGVVADARSSGVPDEAIHHEEYAW